MIACATIWLPERQATARMTCRPKERRSTVAAVEVIRCAALGEGTDAAA
jgi:hypothetical protein